MSDPKATLTASPNPVPAGPGLGRVTVHWTSGRPTSAIYVSTNGGAEKLFAEGSQGTATAGWIQAGTTYQFIMYGDKERGERLGLISVTRPK